MEIQFIFYPKNIEYCVSNIENQNHKLTNKRKFVIPLLETPLTKPGEGGSTLPKNFLLQNRSQPGNFPVLHGLIPVSYFFLLKIIQILPMNFLRNHHNASYKQVFFQKKTSVILHK